jgi:O-antigen/teichoic acid export membrane protein
MFAALAYFTLLGSRIVHSLVTAVSPRIARHYADGDHRRYGRMVVLLCGSALLVGAAAILGALFLGRWALTLVYGPEYAQDLPLFVWLMVAAALEFLCVGLRLALFAARQLKVQVLLLSASVLTVALASLWWVPSAGLVGAAWALCLGWFVELLGSVLLNLRAWRQLRAGGGERP